MPQTITINLTDTLYKQLKRAAQLSRQPTEAVVIQSLTHTLPALLEEIPARYQSDVYPLLQMSDVDLQREANRTFSSQRWAENEALLDRKKARLLTTEEGTRLDTLRREADVLMFRRGYAAVLLKKRGYRLPTLSELAQSR